MNSQPGGNSREINQQKHLYALQKLKNKLKVSTFPEHKFIRYNSYKKRKFSNAQE